MIVNAEGGFDRGKVGVTNAAYLQGMIDAAVHVSGAHGLVLDFRRLSYDYGDEMGAVINTAVTWNCGCERPAAIICNAYNRLPLSTIWREASSDYAQNLNLYDDFKTAVDAVFGLIDGKSRALGRCTTHVQVPRDVLGRIFNPEGLT